MKSLILQFAIYFYGAPRNHENFSHCFYAAGAAALWAKQFETFTFVCETCMRYVVVKSLLAYE